MKAAGSSSSIAPLIEFDIQFGDEIIHVFAPTGRDGSVPATALQKSLAVKLRGKLAPDAKGFFVVINEEGFEKELVGVCFLVLAVLYLLVTKRTG
jgi:hypothetical protein